MTFDKTGLNYKTIRKNYQGITRMSHYCALSDF